MVVPEVDFGCELAGDLGAEVEAGVRSTFGRSKGHLKALLKDLSQKPEEPYEVALSGAIRANQHIQGAKRELLQLPDGFEAFDRYLLNGVGHL